LLSYIIPKESGKPLPSSGKKNKVEGVRAHTAAGPGKEKVVEGVQAHTAAGPGKEKVVMLRKWTPINITPGQQASADRTTGVIKSTRFDSLLNLT
jgi:hypothetical protein